jgi:isopentenyldiphosphate isomerase
MSEEYFPIVNEAGETIGKETRAVCHGGSMLLHPVVHVHVFNSSGELYLQQRNWDKDIQPGKWDTAVGGHIDYGETVVQAVKREGEEEVGLCEINPVLRYSYIWTSSRERELIYVHTLCFDGVILPNPDELLTGRFWTIDEIKAALGKNIFTPNFEYDFDLLLKKEIL